MIDINITEIFITALLENLLKGVLSENKVRNTFIIRIYPSFTYI